MPIFLEFPKRKVTICIVIIIVNNAIIMVMIIPIRIQSFTIIKVTLKQTFPLEFQCMGQALGIR